MSSISKYFRKRDSERLSLDQTRVCRLTAPFLQFVTELPARGHAGGVARPVIWNHAPPLPSTDRHNSSQIWIFAHSQSLERPCEATYPTNATQRHGNPTLREPDDDMIRPFPNEVPVHVLRSLKTKVETRRSTRRRLRVTSKVQTQRGGGHCLGWGAVWGASWGEQPENC